MQRPGKLMEAQNAFAFAMKRFELRSHVVRLMVFAASRVTCLSVC